MSTYWRQFLLALGFWTRIPVTSAGPADSLAALRFLPLVGVLVGLVGALVYCLAALIWPSSIAVVLSMLATLWFTEGTHELGLGKLGLGKLGRTKSGDTPAPDGKIHGAATNFGLLVSLLFLLLKFDALMALSPAKLPFPLPANAGLGIIMIAGHGVSRALLVSVLATLAPKSLRADRPQLPIGGLSFALLTGFLPATFLGLPGLIGLATAIVIRLAVTHRAVAAEATQQLTELGFYLGALGAWAYI